MGTRGFISIVVDGVEKTSYVHCDAYPSGVGTDVYRWVCDVVRPDEVPDPEMSAAVARARRDGRLDAVRDRARQIRVVSSDTLPTAEDIARLNRFMRTSVGAVSDDVSWYQLLRNTQGNLYAIFNAGVIEDASNFPVDSLFAEWGYVVDFDANVFEVYTGFQRHRHTSGRFAHRVMNLHHGYYPVKLVAWWAFSALPETDAAFTRATGEVSRR